MDGVRINNSTVRAGPNQFLNTVDPFIVDQLEVVRGPGSVLYGSDAIGGVINVRTYWPKFRGELTPSLLLRTQGMTADQSLHGHLRAGLSLRDTAVSAAISARDINDLRGGARVGLQPYTAYEEGDAAVKIRQRLALGTELSAQYQAVRQFNAPRLDRSVPGDFRRFAAQVRDLGQVRLERRGWGPLKRAAVEVSVHRQGDVTERFRTARDRIESDAVNVWTLGGRAEGSLPLRPPLLSAGDLVFGVDAYHDKVNASFARTAITDPAAVEARPQDARYPGVPAALAAGAFALLSGGDDEALAYHAGGRVQFNNTRLPEDSRLHELLSGAGQPPPIFPAADVRTVGLAAELGARYRLDNGLQGLLNLSTGFRSPNVDDYLRLGAEGPGFLVPGRDLAPEQSYTAEVGIGWVHQRLRVQTFYAFTVIPGLLGNVPTQVDGAELNPDGLPYLQRLNRDRAAIHAVEAILTFRAHPTLTLDAHGGWTLGTQRRRDLTAPGQPQINEPLARIPPANGLVRLTYEPWTWAFFEAVGRGALRQDALAESDRLDPRICPETFACAGTPGFVVFNLRAGARILGDKLSASVTLQNLLDATYRTHGSGVDEPGRSLAFSLEGRL